MHDERALIPFQVSDLKGTNWLVFSPHPDDETFGMGGAIIKAVSKGVRVTVALMTNGELGGSEVERRNEFESVMKKAGVVNVVFLEFNDRKLNLSEKTVEKTLNIFESEEYDSVFFPSPEEYHPDHRVAAWLVMRSLSIIDYKGLIYSYEISSQCTANTLVDISSQIDGKRDLMLLYQSQLNENNYVDVVASINKSRTYTLPDYVKSAEAFYRYDSCHQDLRDVHVEQVNKASVDILPEDRPLVSILIRTYNRPARLKRALHSIIMQRYGKVEVVVVNDGGEDVSSVINEVSSSIKNIKIIDLKVNSGRSVCANVAMRNATGLLFNFLDDDDEFKPDHLETIIASYRRNRSVKVFYTGSEKINVNGKVVETFFNDFDRNLMLMTNTIPIHSICFSRCVYDQGCRFDETLDYLEDWDFWIQVSRIWEFKFLRKVTTIYHDAGDSVASDGACLNDHEFYVQKVHEKWKGKYSALEWRLGLEALLKMSNGIT